MLPYSHGKYARHGFGYCDELLPAIHNHVPLFALLYVIVILEGIFAKISLGA
jgi:hypothetical protein